MSITTLAIIGLLVPFLPLIFNFVTYIFDYIFNGLQFVFTVFTIIPNFLFNEFLPDMPSFFYIAFSGLVGFMIFNLVLRIVSFFK